MISIHNIQQENDTIGLLFTVIYLSTTKLGHKCSLKTLMISSKSSSILMLELFEPHLKDLKGNLFPNFPVDRLMNLKLLWYNSESLELFLPFRHEVA